MMNDTELLRAYAETRSETAFAAFVERRVGFVYAVAARMAGGDAHTAQDVAQAVFVLVANNAASLARHKRFAGWLHTAARNVACKTVREASHRLACEQEAARMSTIENGNAGENSVHDAERLRPLLDETLGALREGEREAVLLRFFEGKAFAEIGVAMEMSDDAAQKCVTRAVGKMRAAFAKRGVTSSAAALGALMSAEAAQAAPVGLAASVSAGALAAVAGASATGAGVTGAILAFMTSTKITAVALVAILIVASGVSYRVLSERASVASLARAWQENKDLAARLRALEKREEAAATNAPAPAPELTMRERGEAFMAAHPEVRTKLGAVRTAWAAERIFRIAKALNLPPAQNAQLAEIWARYQPFGYGFKNKNGESVFLDGNPNVPMSTTDMHAENTVDAAPRDAEIRALLGDADYEKFQHLIKIDDDGDGDESFQTRELGIRLYLADAPLSAQQAWSIDEIRYDLNQNLPKDTEPETYWKAFQERAKSVLSPEQMNAFADIADGHVDKQTRSEMEREDEAAALRPKTNGQKTDAPQ